jgi:hypothetical protein
VVVLAGNHEAEFLAVPTASKGKEFAAQLKAVGIRPSDVASWRSDIGEFLCSLPFAARVNEWFFSHAGNSGGRSIAQLAARGGRRHFHCRPILRMNALQNH